jgi:putative tryptophan/tyrosine transport system substrate-binding protein
MRRREFIALCGGASLAWPLAAQAQPAKVHRVGALLIGNADAESFRGVLTEELGKLGYTEGRNIVFEFRSAQENLARLPTLAAELVALKVDVIVALYTPCAIAAQKATKEIPVVVISGDPVGTGLVPSLNRPGGNITGVSLIAATLHAKCVELFRDMVPSIRQVAALVNEADPFWKPFLEQVLLVGKGTNIEIKPVVRVHGPGEIDAAFAAVKNAGAPAVVIQGSVASKNTADIAAKYRMPSATISRSYAEAGGLMSYGADAPDSFRRAAVFVNRILRGAKPADMPVEQATKFELVINLKTAKAFGLEIAESFLLRADQVIE